MGLRGLSGTLFHLNPDRAAFRQLLSINPNRQSYQVRPQPHTHLGKVVIDKPFVGLSFGSVESPARVPELQLKQHRAPGTVRLNWNSGSTLYWARSLALWRLST